jgi:hypothetical protein
MNVSEIVKVKWTLFDKSCKFESLVDFIILGNQRSNCSIGHGGMTGEICVFKIFCIGNYDIIKLPLVVDSGLRVVDLLL